MNLSLKKGIFVFLFACFQILFVFSYSTSYELITISSFIVFLLFYFWYFKLKAVLDFKVFFLWLFFLISLVLASFFSHSIPLSIDTLVFYLSSFCIFTFFRSLGESKLFSKFEFGSIILLLGLVLSAFFILFFSFPDLSVFLPPINILTTRYGHSHFAAILLILIPMGWWFSYSKKFTMFRFRPVILVLFYTLLIFSFSRFAIIIGLIQIPFLFKYTNRVGLKKVYGYIVGFLLLASLILALLLSSNSSENCLIKELGSQVCKPISRETRPEYYKQAWKAIKSNPIFGYGPGTFSLITKKHDPAVEQNSIYAHNSFLQIFAESGIFSGVAYLLLIVFLFRNMYLVFKRSKGKFSINNYIFIGLISALLNSFLDYDWNLFPTFQLSIVAMAILLWDFPVRKKKVGSYIQKIVWLVLCSILVILGMINILSKFYISKNHLQKSFELFPYFYSQSKIYLEEESLSSEEKESLYKIYKNHNKFILKKINESSDIEEKKVLYEDYIDAKSWEIVNIDYYDLLVETNEFEKLGQVSSKGIDMLDQLEQNNLPQTYEIRANVLGYLHESANYHISNDELEIGIKYYDKILPNLFYRDSNSDNYSLYQHYLNESLSWDEIFPMYLSNLYKKDLNLARDQLLKIELMHDAAIENGYKEPAFITDKLAVLSLSIANDYLEDKNFDEAARMYILSHKFDKWVFSDRSPRYLYIEGTQEQKNHFWMTMMDLPGDSFGGFSDMVASFHLPMFRNALEIKDADLVGSILNRIIDISSWYTDEMEFSELLLVQELANHFIEMEDWESAEKVVKLINRIGSYRGKMQLGNYYVLVGDNEMAEKAYLTCNAEWKNLGHDIHKDCSIMAKSIDKADKEVFWEISQQILDS